MSSNNDGYYIQILSNINISLYRYIAPILYILGNIGNLLSVLIFLKKAWRKNVCVFYFNVCLYLNTCFINSTMIGTILSTGFNINIQNSSTILCKLTFFSAFFFANMLCTVLILASIDRLLISSQNVETRLYSSKRLAYFSISLATIILFIFFLHILIKVDVQQFGPSIYICYYDQSKFYLDFVAYSSLAIVTISTILMIILSILSFKNVRRIRTIPRQERQQIRTMTKKDFQLLRCLFVKNIIYIVFTFVSLVSTIYVPARKFQNLTLLDQAIDSFVSNMGTILHYIVHCSSFLIFFCVSKAFRNEIKRSIFKIFGKDQRSINEDDHRQENIVKNNTGLNMNVNTIVSRA